MTITEASRHRLHEALIDKLGEEEASTLMEHLPPVGWADVATKTDIEHLRVSMDARFEAFEAKMDGRFEAVDHRFDALEANVTAALATAFSSQMRWVVGTMIAFYAIFGVLLTMLR